MKKLVFTAACIMSLSAVYASDIEVIKSKIATRQMVIDTVDLNEFVGKYKFDGLPFEFLMISVVDGKLTSDTGTEQGPLTPLADSPDKFDASGKATLRFNRDEQKKVNGLTLDAQGMVFEGSKQP